MIRKLTYCAVIALTSQGCYKYSPIAFADVQPEMDIRAEITPDERDGLSEVLPGDDRVLDGTVIDNGGDQLLVQVEAVASQSGVTLQTFDQRVHLNRSGILELEMKELDKGKTYGLTALVTAGVIGVVIAAIQAGNANETGKSGPDGPVDSMIPLLRIPIGF